MAILTLAGFVGLVLFWPALSGRSWHRLLTRTGLLLGINLLVVLTALVGFNAQYQFFADWTDLHGALVGHSTVSPISGGGDAVPTVSVTPQPGSTGPARHRGGGGSSVESPLPPHTTSDDVLSFHVTGAESGLTGQVLVRLPPGYNDPQSARASYPVLETFSGYPSTPRQFLGPMHLGSALDQAATNSALREPIVVSPEIELPAGVDTECVNGTPGEPAVETWVARDIPAWLAQTFRTRTDRTSWATIGLSAGGWCAAMTAMLHPQQFGAAIVLGGYFRPQFGKHYHPYQKGSELSRRYDLVSVAQRTAPPVALWLETSRSDNVSYSSSAALLKVAHAPLSVTGVVLAHAGHRFGIWKAYLVPSLGWLGRTLAGFSASG